MTETSTPLYPSGYERRLNLVTDVLARDSRLDAEEARSLATKVLSELDHIPETVR